MKTQGLAAPSSWLAPPRPPPAHRALVRDAPSDLAIPVGSEATCRTPCGCARSLQPGGAGPGLPGDAALDGQPRAAQPAAVPSPWSPLLPPSRRTGRLRREAAGLELGARGRQEGASPNIRRSELVLRARAGPGQQRPGHRLQNPPLTTPEGWLCPPRDTGRLCR